jgi:hypothetical protein
LNFCDAGAWEEDDDGDGGRKEDEETKHNTDCQRIPKVSFYEDLDSSGGDTNREGKRLSREILGL